VVPDQDQLDAQKKRKNTRAAGVCTRPLPTFERVCVYVQKNQRGALETIMLPGSSRSDRMKQNQPNALVPMLMRFDNECARSASSPL
jgi:hypothetical protein